MRLPLNGPRRCTDADSVYQNCANVAPCNYRLSQIVASQEASDAAIGQHSEDGSTNIDAAASTERSLNATKPIPNLSSSNQALTFRRNTRFYSWRGRCYTQDRDENWYELDGRLC